jgi:oligopeptide transport system permease protein
MAENKVKNNENIEIIDKNDFQFVHQNEKLHDQKFETKPVSFLKDSIRRFAKNKASIVGGCIILLIILFSIFGPLTVQSSDSFK